ncbi:uncharacterized protein [Procambarus clarkii]|uniref:uncharacterized protein n=1 Tax=Procambarus clarkii TaxID=6728 RepID=UPI0037426BB0
MMWWRSAALVVVMLVAMSTVAMAAVVGPKDPLYPDNIVQPRVNCSKEGVFPHPRNCSWFYRCVDRMKVGFYNTLLFECGPGTVFADGLDQCVPRPKATDLCPAPTPLPPTVPTTPANVLRCTDQQTRPKEDWIVKEYCQVFTLCDASKTFKGLQELCTNFYQCHKDHDGSWRFELSNCLPPLMYSFTTDSCVPRPSATDLCPAPTPLPPTVPTTPANVLRCTDQQTRPKEDWIVKEYCQNFTLCDASKTFKGLQELCTNFYQCHKDHDGSWRFELSNCLPPLMYSFTTDSCVPRPSDNELC